jgi:hypothetical protein
MGPLMVKLGAEVIEPQLLGGQVGQWRLGGFRFEGLEHAFVPSVLLRFPGRNAHWSDAQFNPPHRPVGSDRQRSERRAIIREPDLRQTALAE